MIFDLAKQRIPPAIEISMKYPTQKFFLFGLSLVVAGWMTYPALRTLLQNPPHHRPDLYSHIFVIPLISGYFLLSKRKEIFSRSESFYIPGLGIMGAALALFFVTRSLDTDLNDHASLAVLSAVVFLMGSFLFLFGSHAFRKSYFPIALMLLAIPFPTFLMNKVISALVAGTAGVVQLLFKAFGVPFTREGSVFYPPGFGLEIAYECSGIRSSMALLITGILAAHLFLDRLWKKAILLLAVFPVVVFKNGVRVVTLYMLSYHVDMRIIEGGFLHRSGGFVFFLLGLGVLAFFLWLLKKIA
jgi:exosortase